MKSISKLKNSTESAVKCGSRLVACRTEDAVELVAEVDAVIAERDQLRAEVEALRGQLAESRSNDRTAMGYLAEVRAIVGGEDFPAMVRNVDALRRDAERWRKAREILTVEAIETAHSDFVNFGLPPDEKENVRADDAIDAALAGKGGGE